MKCFGTKPGLQLRRWWDDARRCPGLGFAPITQQGTSPRPGHCPQWGTVPPPHSFYPFSLFFLQGVTQTLSWILPVHGDDVGGCSSG